MPEEYLVLLIAALMGLVGGMLYYLMPPDVIEQKLEALLRRIVAGAIVGGLMSPLLMAVVNESGWALSYSMMTVVIGLIASGYFAIDILKTLVQTGKLPTG